MSSSVNSRLEMPAADIAQAVELSAINPDSNRSMALEDSLTASKSDCLIDIRASSQLIAPHLRYRFNSVNYCKTKNHKSTQILKDVYGEFESGSLTAILGPSGAGKSSLLNILAGFKTTGVRGEFEVNGQRMKANEFRKISTYIQQEFSMIPELNVLETIQVAMDLKLPQKTAKSRKTELLKEILGILHLEDQQKTLVKHLSGGERKRLSIGVELVTNPAIMFFDEPTSGLDSVTSHQIISYLKKLAEKGRIVVCVVHQPSSIIMQLFDNILLLSKGEVLYSGTQKELLERFAKFDFVCPQYYNPADFVLEVASYLEHKQPVRELAHHNREAFNQSGKSCPDKIKEQHEIDGLKCNILDGKPSVTGRDRNSLVWQFSVLVARSLRSMSRNMLAVQLRIIMHLVVGVLLGIVYHQMGNDAGKVLTNVSCVFFIVLFIFFGNAMPAIFLASSDTQVFLREYLNSWYSLKSYYTSKLTADLPLQLLCPTLLISIVYLMSGQPVESKRFLMCWSLSLLIAIIGHFMGLVLGATFGVQMGIFLVPAISIPFMIFSGFFIRLHEIPFVLRFFCDISFFRYTMEGFLRALYGYDREPLQCLSEFCYYKDPSKFLRDFGMSGNFYSCDVLALLLWAFFLKGMFFASLLWCIRRSQ